MNLTSREALTSIVDLFDAFLFDFHVVLYNGDAAIDGAVKVTDMLRSKGMQNHRRIKPSNLIT
jgi:ribonucleotide monophosphatase NagD (HAD superfamily)